MPEAVTIPMENGLLLAAVLHLGCRYLHEAREDG